MGFTAGWEAGDEDELRAGRQRVYLLFRGAMVDLLAWRRYGVCVLRQFLERKRYDDSARAVVFSRIYPC